MEHRIRLLTACTDGPPSVYPAEITTLLAAICTATLGGPTRGYASVLHHLTLTVADPALRAARRALASVLYTELTARYQAVYPNLPAQEPYTGAVPAIGITSTGTMETLAFNLHDEKPTLEHAPYWSAALDVYAAGVSSVTGVRPVIGRVLYAKGGSLVIPCDGLLARAAEQMITGGIRNVRRRGAWCPGCPIGCSATIEPARRRS